MRSGHALECDERRWLMIGYHTHIDTYKAEVAGSIPAPPTR